MHLLQVKKQVLAFELSATKKIKYIRGNKLCHSRSKSCTHSPLRTELFLDYLYFTNLQALTQFTNIYQKQP